MVQGSSEIEKIALRVYSLHYQRLEEDACHGLLAIYIAVPYLFSPEYGNKVGERCAQHLRFFLMIFGSESNGSIYRREHDTKATPGQPQDIESQQWAPSGDGFCYQRGVTLT